MKKTKLVLAFIGLIMFTKGYSQSLEIGLQGMYNTAGVINPNNYGSHDYNYVTRYGTEYGLDLTYKFNKKIGVQVEINTSAQGYNNTHSDNTFTYNRTVDLNYLQVPIMFKFNTGGSIARYYLLGGIQFGFLNSAKYNVDSVHVAINKSYNTTVDMLSGKEYSGSDFGIVIATGVEVNFIPKLYANVGVRINYGLADLNATAFKKADGSISNNYWGGLELGVHYMIY